MGGTSLSDISGEKSEESRYFSYDYWILKLDSQGAIEWQKTYGGDDQDVLYIIKQTTDLGYILAGNSMSGANYDKTENCRGGEDYWIMKLDSSGEILWQKTFGGSELDNVTDIQQNYEDGFYVSGFSLSGISGDKTSSLFGTADFWILKLDSLGNIIWQKTIEGDQGDYFNTLYVNPDHSVIVGGQSDSGISGDKTENSRGSSDIWMLKLNEFGAIIWQKTIGGNQADGVKSIKKTSQNEYLLGGVSRSSISGEKSENCRGESDYWFIKLNDENLSVFDSHFQNNLSISPNPNNGIFTISDLETAGKLEIYDVLGKKMHEQSINNNESINLETASKGIYFAKIIAGNNVYKTEKIIVE